MKLLVLGGTLFLGRHLVEAAQKDGHEVALFNRGRTSPELFPGIEKLRGDRDGDLSALQGRSWDAAVDTSGGLPRQLRASMGVLADQVEHYTFISSLSVYADLSQIGITEAAATAVGDDPDPAQVTPERYGALKALCEQEAERAMPGRVLVARSGLIVGPYDPSDRFSYWPARIGQGGRVLVPADPQPVQLIDVRDQADWILRSIEAKRAGVFNVTGPASKLMLSEAITECQRVSSRPSDLVPIPDSYLAEQELSPWVDLPFYLGPRGLASQGLLQVDNKKAVAAGLSFRPLAETCRATMTWAARERPFRAMKVGLKPEREREVIESWLAGRGRTPL